MLKKILLVFWNTRLLIYNDNASNMSGISNGVQAHVLNDNKEQFPSLVWLIRWIFLETLQQNPVSKFNVGRDPSAVFVTDHAVIHK